MDDRIQAKFDYEYLNTSNPNYEKIFLEQIAQNNVSLYKANALLNNWGRLKINPINGSTQNIPCK